MTITNLYPNDYQAILNHTGCINSLDILIDASPLSQQYCNNKYTVILCQYCNTYSANIVPSALKPQCNIDFMQRTVLIDSISSC
jgi:hypothetical protein